MFAHFAFVCVTLSAGSEAAITNKPISSALCLELCAHACHQRHTVLPTVTQQTPCSFTSILPVFMWHRVDSLYSLQVATCCVMIFIHTTEFETRQTEKFTEKFVNNLHVDYVYLSLFFVFLCAISFWWKDLYKQICYTTLNVYEEKHTTCSDNVPAYSIIIAMIVIQKNLFNMNDVSVIELNSYACRTLESSFMVLATNTLRSLFSDTLFFHKFPSATGNCWLC